MSKINLLIKQENDEIDYIFDGDFGLETSKGVKPLQRKTIDHIMAILPNEPMVNMIEFKTGKKYKRFPDNLRQISKIHDEKEKHFEIKHIEIDLLDLSVDCISVWKVDMVKCNGDPFFEIKQILWTIKE
jgi:hypothetical protein